MGYLEISFYCTFNYYKTVESLKNDWIIEEIESEKIKYLSSLIN